MRHRLALLTVLAVSTSTAIAAPAALAQSTSPVVINEVESNGDAVGDWVELANTNTSESVDISGWTIIDGDATHTPITIPEGTSIESGGYYVLHTEPSFGLGGASKFCRCMTWVHSITGWLRSHFGHSSSYFLPKRLILNCKMFFFLFAPGLSNLAVFSGHS